MRFCLHMHRRTFGDAGRHRKRGHSELSCDFSLGQWAAALELDKSNVRQIRADLEACHILSFTPDPTEPGRGTLSWNTAFTEWQRYDHRGRPKRASVVISSGERDNITTLARQKSDNITTAACLNGDNITTLARQKAAVDAARAAPLINNKRRIPVTIVTGEAQGASAVAVRDVSPTLFGDPAPSARAGPRRPQKTKLTPEQLAAHRAEQAWCSELLAALRAELGLRRLPNEGKERDAAHWFYGELQGVEDAVTKVMTCYRVTKRDPFYQTRPLSLQKLREFFPEYRRDPKGYRARIAAAGAPRAHGAAAAPHEPVIHLSTADKHRI
jgi:hypothetical protein